MKCFAGACALPVEKIDGPGKRADFYDNVSNGVFSSKLVGKTSFAKNGRARVVDKQDH